MLWDRRLSPVLRFADSSLAARTVGTSRRSQDQRVGKPGEKGLRGVAGPFGLEASGSEKARPSLGGIAVSCLQSTPHRLWSERVFVGGGAVGWGDHASSLLHKQELCEEARPAWPAAEEVRGVSISAPAVGCLGRRGPWSPDSHTLLQGLVGNKVSLATWTRSIFQPVPGPTQTTGRCEVDVHVARPALDLKTPPSPPPPQPALPSLLPLHSCHLVRSVAFGGLSSSSSFTIGRGGVGPACFPMGCMGCVCGLGLVTGRRWFLVEGLDQACARQGHRQGSCSSMATCHG